MLVLSQESNMKPFETWYSEHHGYPPFPWQSALAARLVDDASPYLAGVQLATNAGVYTVLLSRAAQDDPWRVERITPSAGSGT